MLPLVLVLLASACGGPRSGEAQVPLAWFHRPPADIAVDRLATAYDRFVLTQLDERLVDDLRGRGQRGPFLQYLRFEGVMDDSDQGYQWHNQVAWRPGDWERISRDHPDWFLLGADGQRLRTGAGGPDEERFYLMDPANPQWRAFFVGRLRDMQARGGWDGVFLDNVEISLGKRERHGQVPARYPTDASWAAANEAFLAHLRRVWADRDGRPMEANVIEARTADDERLRRVLPHLDGVMREGWLDGDDLDWDGRLREAERAQEQGLHVWLPANGDRADAQEQRFALASFLLADRGRASFRYTSSDAYDEAWLYDDYWHDLGEPTGPRRRDGDLWHRPYEGGSVTVDPVRRTGRIDAG